MSAASNYTENNIIDALLRGVPFPIPENTYVSLHTDNPGETGENEVSADIWPQYARVQAEQSEGMGAGWTPPIDGVSQNEKPLMFPSMNGPDFVTVTHWAIYDALKGGNMLVYAPLQTPRTLYTGDIFVFDSNAITVTAA